VNSTWRREPRGSELPLTRGTRAGAGQPAQSISMRPRAHGVSLPAVVAGCPSVCEPRSRPSAGGCAHYGLNQPARANVIDSRWSAPGASRFGYEYPHRQSWRMLSDGKRASSSLRATPVRRRAKQRAGANFFHPRVDW